MFLKNKITQYLLIIVLLLENHLMSIDLIVMITTFKPQ